MTGMSEDYVKRVNREWTGWGRIVHAFHEGLKEGVSHDNWTDKDLRIVHLIKRDLPIFHDWSFETDINYDSSVISIKEIRQGLKKVGAEGFGDWFRGSYGRAKIEVTYEGLA